MMKAIVLFSLVWVICSCDKNNTYKDYEEDTFYFPDKVLNIAVKPDTKSFCIQGRLEKVSRDIDKYFIRVVPGLTTAENGIQYQLPKELLELFFKFPVDSVVSELVVPVFPEKIDRPVKIVFTSLGKIVNKDYTRYNDTLTVNLLPQPVE